MQLGLPRMHKERGEVRDFLPDLVAYTAEHHVSAVVLEEGYGAGMGFTEHDYARVSSKVKFGSYADCLAQDVVMVMRAPSEDALRKIRPGAVLLSMLHYTTQPLRTALLLESGIAAVSLDALVDDQGRRLVEDMSAVGWNGIEAAFRELARAHPRFADPARGPLRVTILGAGQVAGAALTAASRYGDRELHSRLSARGIPGVETTVIDYDLTRNKDYMASLLARSDMLVDATRRRHPNRVIVTNKLLGALPGHAVILDLAADPYDFDTSPQVVKAIEGVPHGDLDQFVFRPDDPVYDDLSTHVDTTNRRIALSCYSWPGIHPRPCMDLYGVQLEPIVDIVLTKAPNTWSLTSDNHVERALARAEVTRWSTMMTTSR